MSERLAYRLDEMAELLGIHHETLRLWAERGQIPALKAGRIWLFSPDAVTQWLHNAQRGEASDGNRIHPQDHRPADGSGSLGGSGVDRGPRPTPLPTPLASKRTRRPRRSARNARRSTAGDEPPGIERLPRRVGA